MFVTLTATKHTCLLIRSTRVLPESDSLGRYFRENLQQTHFQLFCRPILPASGLIYLKERIIESNKLNLMMKYHSDFLPAKSELATRNNKWDIAIFVQPG